MTSASRSDAGFSLLELVAALAIMALMSVAILDSSRLGIKSWSRVHLEADKNEQAMLTHARLSTWIRNAYPANPGRISGEIHFPLLGTKNTVSFLAPIHPDDRIGDLYRVKLGISSTATFSAQITPDFAPAATPTEATLHTGIEQVEFSYLDDDNTWRDEWLNDSNLPKAVRVSLSFKNRDISWPELVVRPLAQEWGPCRYDTEANKKNNCRPQPYLTPGGGE